MERRDREAVATFFSPEPIVAGTGEGERGGAAAAAGGGGGGGNGRVITLDAAEARHARVRRTALGDRVRLVDGAGGVGRGRLVGVGKTHAAVEVAVVDCMAPLPAIHLMVPVADRDRMLLLAEKATEMGVSSWRPVLWRRSRDVRPRGEGVTFQGKARSRMVAALTQCGGAWLPLLHPDATPDRAIAACPPGTRWLLDAEGDTAEVGSVAAPITIAVGPEGGLEEDERAALMGAGFHSVRLGPLTLRFETAAIAGMALARAALERDHQG